MKSIPDMRALRDAFGHDELTLVGIPVASIDTDEKLRDYIKTKKPAYAVQVGLPQEVTQHVRDLVAARLQANGETTPASFITDSSGRILAVRWGIPTLSELKQIEATAEE
jgi:type IV secretory pathway protease TraF